MSSCEDIPTTTRTMPNSHKKEKILGFFQKKDRRSLSSSRECSLRKCHPVLSLKNIIPPSYPKGIRNKCFRNIFFLDIWVQFPLPGIVSKSQVGTSTQIPLLLWRAAQARHYRLNRMCPLISQVAALNIPSSPISPLLPLCCRPLTD